MVKPNEKKINDVFLIKNFWLTNIKKGKNAKEEIYYRGDISMGNPGKPGENAEFWGTFDNSAKSIPELKKQIIKRLKYQKDI